MSGHISMMNDVLITQLQPSVLRSAVRTILAQIPEAKRLFVSHVRSRLKEAPTPFPEPMVLFPKDSTVPSGALKEYLASGRCYFSCHLIRDSLSYLAHFFKAIPMAGALWAPGSDLERALEAASHDAVQSVQALKESDEETDDKLRTLLYNLLRAISDCSAYCQARSLTIPFARAQLQVSDGISFLFPTVELNGYVSSYEPKLQVQTSESVVPTEKVKLGAIEVPRLFNGLWQMSSPAWGTAASDKVDDALIALVQAGLVAADMADHYGDAELLYGSFRNRLPGAVSKTVIAATKWCVFSPLKESVSKELVLAAVKERTRRLNGRADILQFHWQDYSNKDYLLVIQMLVDLTRTHPELVGVIGLCNFDAKTTAEVCEYMLAKTGAVGIVSNQVQYSLIDSRPIFDMAKVCARYGIKLLTYGTFCGGFLSDRWLNKPSPDLYSETTTLTPSQRKYFDMIEAWGTWADFQRLLLTLRKIADAHQVDISNVSTRWVLQRPEVGVVIVGSRLGLSSHAADNCRVFTFDLTEADLAAIDAAALGSRAKALFEAIGDCGAEYR